MQTHTFDIEVAYIYKHTVHQRLNTIKKNVTVTFVLIFLSCSNYHIIKKILTEIISIKWSNI